MQLQIIKPNKQVACEVSKVEAEVEYFLLPPGWMVFDEDENRILTFKNGEFHWEYVQ